MSHSDRKLEIALLALRVSVAVVMLAWAIDKLLRPEHSGSVFEGFYGLPIQGETVFMVLGIAQIALVMAFVAGVFRTWTYGAILALHAVSTLSSWRQYADPYVGANLLFFAAWPMLAACLALFLLRDQDRLMTLGRR